MVQVSGRRSPKWAFMSKMVIPSKRNTGELYLVRWRVIQTPWFGVFVHKINEPDFDRDCHDHPWNFTSIILRGGYTEEVWPVPRHLFMPDTLGAAPISYQRRWNLFSRHRMTTEKAHKIISVKPGTISLILVGRRFRDWGFWTPQGWVVWTEYLDVPGEVMFSSEVET